MYMEKGQRYNLKYICFKYVQISNALCSIMELEGFLLGVTIIITSVKFLSYRVYETFIYGFHTFNCSTFCPYNPIQPNNSTDQIVSKYCEPN